MGWKQAKTPKEAQPVRRVWRAAEGRPDVGVPGVLPMQLNSASLSMLGPLPPAGASLATAQIATLRRVQRLFGNQAAIRCLRDHRGGAGRAGAPALPEGPNSDGEFAGRAPDALERPPRSYDVVRTPPTAAVQRAITREGAVRRPGGEKVFYARSASGGTPGELRYEIWDAPFGGSHIETVAATTDTYDDSEPDEARKQQRWGTAEQKVFNQEINSLVKTGRILKIEGRQLYKAVGARAKTLDEARQLLNEELERRLAVRKVADSQKDFSTSKKILAADKETLYLAVVGESLTDVERAVEEISIQYARMKHERGGILSLSELQTMQAAAPKVSPNDPYTPDEALGILNAALQNPDTDAQAHLANSALDAQRKATARRGSKPITTVYQSLKEAADDLLAALNTAQANGRALRAANTGGGPIDLGVFATVAARNGYEGDINGNVRPSTWNNVEVTVQRGLLSLTIKHFTPRR